jgi:hypothetical protein
MPVLPFGGGGYIDPVPPASWQQTWEGPGGPSAYGTKPQVPLPPATAQEAITGNIGNLGSIYGLGAGLNQFQTAQAARQLQQNLPGYQGMITQSSGNIGQMLAGQVPSDVVTNLIQGAAERGIMTGSPGSPNANSALLRALGLTSLGLQQTGEQELTQAIGRTPRPALFQPESMLVSPEQQQAAQYAQALYTAAPDPTAAAQASLATAGAGLRAGLGTGVSTMLPYSNLYGAIPQQPQAPDTSQLGLSYGGTVYPPGVTPTAAQRPSYAAGGPSTWDDYLADQTLSGV